MKSQHYADFTGLFKVLGAATAQAEFDENKVYTEEVFGQAFSVANEKFNLAAAALAAATEGIDHMFEWNVAKVNRRGGPGGGRGKAANDEASRLWTPVFSGKGKDKRISFIFKPSVLKVPKPTTRETGMSQEKINRLKDHYFPNKAMVFELGLDVTVKRKPGTKALLVPYSSYMTDHTRRMFNEKEKNQGFMYRTGPFTFSPGRISGQSGQFTKFWAAYWSDPGSRVIANSIADQANKDFNLKGIGFKSNMPVPVQRIHMKKEINQAKKEMSKRAIARAKRRGKKIDEQ